MLAIAGSNFKLLTYNFKLLSPCAGITLIRFCGFDLSLLRFLCLSKKAPR